MAGSSGSFRTFVKCLIVWSSLYVLTLYTWKKPNIPLSKDYMNTYDLEHAPIWSFEEALHLNSEHCGTVGINFDRTAVAANKAKWSMISEEDIFFWRQSMLKYLENAKHEGKTSERGIVMSAGDRPALLRAKVSISLLRHHGCKLPVQIYHYEDEADKMEQVIIDELSLLDADVVELSGLKRGAEWKAYQIKAIAIQRCNFDEILYLDTDTYVAKDPTYLFDSPGYQETGAMLWPDFTKSHPTNPVWRLLGIPCRSQFEGESGELLLNRAKHQKTMHLAEFFALENDKFYHMMGGDRDSFRIALMALNKKWSGPRRLVATAGLQRKNGGHTMLQSDHEGNWLFVHANLLKHSSLPRDEPVTWNKIKRIKNDNFAGRLGYGQYEGNEKLGDNIRVEVSPMPSMFTEYSSFRDDQKEVAQQAWFSENIVVEGFAGADLALIEFEKLFFRYGGIRS